MRREPTWLADGATNVYTKSGEDGIVERILNLLPARDRWCVEFGAWDGISRSNTRHLIDNGYAAVLIEASAEKFASLRANNASLSSVITVNAFVGFRPGDSLDKILADTPIPVDFDFVSIDVDGNDYHIWKVIQDYRPKLVCIEFNPTIPTEVEFVQPADPSVSHGASLASMVKLGKEKDYELVSVTDVNAFFVDAKYFPLFGIDDNRPSTLRKDSKSITYIFSGYDGTVFVRGLAKLRWHDGLPIKESSVQFLPRFLRNYPGNYNSFQRLAFWVYYRASSPWDFAKRVVRRLRTVAKV